MELVKPKFMDTEYVYFDADGVKIKENSPEWVKEEYEKFIKQLNEHEVL